MTEWFYFQKEGSRFLAWNVKEWFFFKASCCENLHVERSFLLGWWTNRPPQVIWAWMTWKGGEADRCTKTRECWIGRLRRFAFSPFQLIDSRRSLISEFRRGKFDAGGAGREFHGAWRPNTPLSHDNTKDTVLLSAQSWWSPWLI